MGFSTINHPFWGIPVDGLPIGFFRCIPSRQLLPGAIHLAENVENPGGCRILETWEAMNMWGCQRSHGEPQARWMVYRGKSQIRMMTGGTRISGNPCPNEKNRRESLRSWNVRWKFCASLARNGECICWKGRQLGESTTLKVKPGNSRTV